MLVLLVLQTSILLVVNIAISMYVLILPNANTTYRK
jgi:hypothetical protein